ncbi:hypothetical protein IFM89_011595 [Coptis chinensis]|uniref:Midasin n=1 Tax=Coptis chinensis TaxID=261450 RepID=A0A835LGV6_9MAGN|nr:hypothetical protein IFM89_011595 [Coptis chinensis]
MLYSLKNRTGTDISKHDAGKLREQCLSFLLQSLKSDIHSEDSQLSQLQTFGWDAIGRSEENMLDNVVQSDKYFGIAPFNISKGDDDCKPEGFEFLAPTTCRNAMRVLRAMQLRKPVLLEGSPGVGKTSLIVAIGKYSGHRVVRINLSEQGLNAILDHRAEVFIPELGQTYKCPTTFRVFACQNPSCPGGGRKGLPKSFLNRFTKVYVDELVDDDYFYICNSLHPSIPKPLLSKLILFNKRLYSDTMISHNYGREGSPWEFNLRDIIRSCQIIEGAPESSKEDVFLNTVYIQRMHTAADRQEVVKLYPEVFGVKPFINPYPRLQVNPRYLIVGNTVIERNRFQPYETLKCQLSILPGIRHSLESVAHCVQHQWLCILVGPSASGKSSVVILLADLTGNVLNELNLSSATDISELLGCFEQYNAFCSFRSAITQVERYIDEYCGLSLELEAIVLERKDLVSRLIWYTEWRKKVVFALEHWCATRKRRILENEEPLSDLLKLLESCGLSRHRSMSSEDAHGSNQPTSWFLQPSYNMQHLLVPPNGNCSIVDATCNSQSLKPLPNNFDSSWIAANYFYYSSMAMVHLLRKICLNFHKDISLDQKLFDSLYALSHETSVFLRRVEVTHLNTCQSVKFEANEVLACIEKLLPNIRKSKPMEQLVMQNFVVLSELEENIQAFAKHDVDKRSVKEPLIGHFLDLLNKGKATMQEFCSFLEPIQDISVPDNDASSGKSSDCEAKFASSFNETLVLIRVAYEKFGSLTNGLTHCEDSLSENINQWKVLVGSYRANMKFDCIHKQLGETITTAV